LGARRFLAAGLTLQAIGLGWIALQAGPDTAYPTLIPPLIIAGAGVSMALPSAQNAAVNAVPAGMIGKAAGTNSTLRELGGVFGIAIAVAVFSRAPPPVPPRPPPPPRGAAPALAPPGAPAAPAVRSRRDPPPPPREGPPEGEPP